MVFLTHAKRNGANFSVYVNTAQEFDGSDAGFVADAFFDEALISQSTS